MLSSGSTFLLNTFPQATVARLVAEGVVLRARPKTYLQHPRWRVVWEHMKSLQGIAPRDALQELELFQMVEQRMIDRFAGSPSSSSALEDHSGSYVDAAPQLSGGALDGDRLSIGDKVTIDDAAKALAARATEQASSAVADLAASIRLDDDGANEVFAGFLFFCLHMAERAALAKLPDVTAEHFRHQIENRALDLVANADLGVPDQLRASVRSKLSAALALFHQEFAGYSPAPPAKTTGMAGNIFYEFGKHIARATATPNEALVIAVITRQAVTAVNALGAPKLLGEVRDSIRAEFERVDQLFEEQRPAIERRGEATRAISIFAVFVLVLLISWCSSA